MQRLIVGMTGATGTIYVIRILELLRGSGIETHLVMSKWALRTLLHETRYGKAEVEALASVVHHPGDQLAAIAHGTGEHLVHRAADVVLKERRRLVLAVREAPLSDIHLENMLKLSRMGVTISPPVPAFYQKPATIDDLVT